MIGWSSCSLTDIPTLFVGVCALPLSRTRSLTGQRFGVEPFLLIGTVRGTDDFLGREVTSNLLRCRRSQLEPLPQATEKALAYLLMGFCLTLKERLQSLQLAGIQPDTAACHATIYQDL